MGVSDLVARMVSDAILRKRTMDVIVKAGDAFFFELSELTCAAWRLVRSCEIIAFGHDIHFYQAGCESRYPLWETATKCEKSWRRVIE